MSDDVLPNAADHLLMVLYAAKERRTQAQLAHALYGTPVHPVSDAAESRRRTTAIRNVQELIHTLRLRGHAVCSDEDGVFIARTSADAYADAERLRRRYRSQAETAWAQRRNARRMEAAETVGEQEIMFSELGDAA